MSSPGSPTWCLTPDNITPTPPFPLVLLICQADADLEAPALSCRLLESPPVGCATPCCVVDPPSLGSIYPVLRVGSLSNSLSFVSGVWEWNPPYSECLGWNPIVCLAGMWDWCWVCSDIRDRSWGYEDDYALWVRGAHQMITPSGAVISDRERR